MPQEEKGRDTGEFKRIIKVWLQEASKLDEVVDPKKHAEAVLDWMCNAPKQANQVTDC